MKYDFAVIGRWRNYDFVNKVVATIREHGFSCYSFVDNDWSHHGKIWQTDDIDRMMSDYEKLAHDSPEMVEIFEKDLRGMRDAESVILALPVGNASSMEAGIAFGLGKPLHAVGKINAKSETLFNIIGRVFPSIEEFSKFLKEEK